MDNLIYDAVSIYTQILMQIAPDHIADFEFLLTAYIFASLFVLIVLWSFCRILSSFANSMISWLSRGN